MGASIIIGTGWSFGILGSILASVGWSTENNKLILHGAVWGVVGAMFLGGGYLQDRRLARERRNLNSKSESTYNQDNDGKRASTNHTAATRGAVGFVPLENGGMISSWYTF